MKKITKYLSLFMSASCAPLFLSAGCSKDTTQKKEFKILLSENVSAELISEIERILESKISDYDFKIEVKNDYNTAISEVVKGNVQLAFPSVSALIKSKKITHVKPVLQTLSRAFNSDYDGFEYVDGLANDPLRKIANLQSEEFNTHPFKEWGLTNYDSNLGIYTNFYNMSKSVSYQRGVIWISGSDELRVKIVRAWNERDWHTFRSFGIIHGKPDSGSKFILPENILKKHFNKDGNSFSTLSQEIINNKNLFSQGKISDLHKKVGMHIVFDNQGAYTWTESKEKNFDKFTPRDGEKLEMLIVTNPLPYNIGIFNKNLSDDTIDKIINVLLNLSEQGEDKMGLSQGFVGYSKIEDINKVEKMYENATK